MRTLIVSSSQRPDSRSNRLSQVTKALLLERGHDVAHIHLAPGQLPGFDCEDLFENAVYQEYAKQVDECDALILASPVYNWSFCAELKKFIEIVGSTELGRPSPFFDKLVSLLFAAGLPHSCMAFGTLAVPLMMDFRCVINPYQAYIHNRHWSAENEVNEEGLDQLDRMLLSHISLAQRLQGHRLTSRWQP